MKLIVGLGNPGRKYEQTRHNIGFEVIQVLAQRHATGPGRLKFEGLVQEGLLGSEKIVLLMPHTFMNLSGRCVKQTADFFKIPVTELLMVCDDFHLPLGTLRLRPGGSAGGQKGLADTIRQLGTDQFARLRLGIGPVPDRWDPADFVLGKFGTHERKAVDELVGRACQAVETWVEQGPHAAMSKFNSGPSVEPRTAGKKEKEIKSGEQTQPDQQ